MVYSIYEYSLSEYLWQFTAGLCFPKEVAMRHSYPLRATLLLATLCILFLAACGGTSSTVPPTPTPSTATLNVFAAASLTESFTQIAMKYHQAHPNIVIKLSSRAWSTTFSGDYRDKNVVASLVGARLFYGFTAIKWNCSKTSCPATESTYWTNACASAA